MKITESQLRAIIKQELKNIINEAVPTDDEMWGPYVPKPRVPLTPQQKAERAAKAAATRLRNKEESAEREIRSRAWQAAQDAQPPEEREYFKHGSVEATPEEYDSNLYAGGGRVWKGEDGKYYKNAIVPATEAEYNSALAGGGRGFDVWRKWKEVP